jgi:cytochrome c oxidase subunit 3
VAQASTAAVSSHPVDPQRRTVKEFNSYLGMVIFLAAWGMMFAALFFAYGEVRVTATSWPPEGQPRLPIFWPALATVVLLASSVTMQIGLRTIRNWRVVDLPRWILATLLLGVLFIGLQTMGWIAVGHSFQPGIYRDVFYALTCVHAAHVVAGLIALVAILVPAYRGKYRKNKHTGVRLVTMFWHFIDVVWVLMFIAVYAF